MSSSSSSMSFSEGSTGPAADASQQEPPASLASLRAADLVDCLYRYPGRQDLFDEAAFVLAGRERRLAEAEGELQAAHQLADRLLGDIREGERAFDAATAREARLRDEAAARERRLAETQEELRLAHTVLDQLVGEMRRNRLIMERLLSEARGAAETVADLRAEVQARDRAIADAGARIRQFVEAEAVVRTELQARDHAIAALDNALGNAPTRVPSPLPWWHGQVESIVIAFHDVPVQQRREEAPERMAVDVPQHRNDQEQRAQQVHVKDDEEGRV